MSTQIFINPNTCKPEFTKIAGHSFSFTPNFLRPVLFSGGTIAGQSIWSVTTYDYSNVGFAPTILEADKLNVAPETLQIGPEFVAVTVQAETIILTVVVVL